MFRISVIFLVFASAGFSAQSATIVKNPDGSFSGTGQLDPGANTVSGSLDGACAPPSPFGGNCNGAVEYDLGEFFFFDSGNSQETYSFTIPDGFSLGAVSVEVSSFVGPSNIEVSSSVYEVSGPRQEIATEFSITPSDSFVSLTSGASGDIFELAMFGQRSDEEGPFSLDYTFNVDVIPSAIEQLPVFGTAAAAATRNNEFAIFADQYEAGINSDDALDAAANAVVTNGGTAFAIAEVLGVDPAADIEFVPGLEVGAFANASEESVARSFAFRAYEYDGASETVVTVNSELDGEFNPAPFGLSNSGSSKVAAEVAAIELSVFNEALALADGDIEALFFPLANKNTIDFDPESMLDFSLSDIFGSVLGSGTFEAFFNVGFTDTELDFLFSVGTGDEFVLIYDLTAFSVGGEVDFLSTFSSANTLFTDTNGSQLAGFTALGDVPELNAVPIPGSALLLFGGLCSLMVASRRRRVA